MDFCLHAKTAVVAGSSRGIGRGIAASLLREGANVLLTGRDAVALNETRREFENEFGAERVDSFPGDLSSRDICADVIAAAQKKWKSIDVVVANVGTGRGKMGWELSDADWDGMFSANLLTSVRLIESALSVLIEARHGAIVAVASIAGFEALPAPLPYSAAKAALLSYVKNLSGQLGGYGIRVNAVAPGNILAPGGTWEKKLKENETEVRRFIRDEVPLQRFGRADEIGDAVAFLASERAAFITGSCLVVDGGQSRHI